MTRDYRAELFASYDVRAAALDGDDRAKLQWFDQYARTHYLPHLTRIDPATADVLDIGCNKGYLLAALRAHGFRRLRGVDLSPQDVDKATYIAADADITCGDAFEYLAVQRGSFDVIFMKAVLEHTTKGDVLRLLAALRRALRPGGVVLVDVPNMDWLFASHERYMDFTHEVGFTKESLLQVMRQIFPSVDIVPLDNVAVATLRVRVARRLLGTLLKWADPEGGANPLWARSLLGIGRA